MGFSVEPQVSLMGATTADAPAANPTLAGLDECARLVHKPLRSFINVSFQRFTESGGGNCNTNRFLGCPGISKESSGASTAGFAECKQLCVGRYISAQQ